MTNGLYTFSLSANGVGGEGNFRQVHNPAEIERQRAEKKFNHYPNQSNRDWFPVAGFNPSFL